MPEDRYAFDLERARLFKVTHWVRARTADLLEMQERGLRNITQADVLLWKAWLTYWQALRDMPNQEGFDPVNPVWPEMPE